MRLFFFSLLLEPLSSHERLVLFAFVRDNGCMYTSTTPGLFNDASSCPWLEFHVGDYGPPGTPTAALNWLLTIRPSILFYRHMPADLFPSAYASPSLVLRRRRKSRLRATMCLRCIYRTAYRRPSTVPPVVCTGHPENTCRRQSLHY
ncbi:hypothetical protein F5I97DRAFT_978208 [Phlebopus sp. FC_14]|nr:hypothetical protein F5I97DRAFT_978208 [Phlebopus sp. FC_14]